MMMAMPLIVLVFFLLLLGFSGQLQAGNTASCKAYYEKDFIQDQKDLQFKVIAIEDRVPAGFECLHFLREQLHAQQEQLKTQSMTTAVTSDKAIKDTADIKKLLKTTKNQISALEEDLRNIAKRLDKMVSSRCGCIKDRQVYEDQLISIRHYLKIPDHERLFIDFNDYDRYFFKLNIGYEYTSVSKILAQSSPRLGLLINTHYGRRPYHDEYGTGYFGTQLSGNLTLSGATEQRPTSQPATQTAADEKTLGIDVFLFTPLLRTKIRPDLGLKTGPLLMLGAKQTDESKKVNERIYVGIRSAVSPAHYLDLLFGRSMGLKSGRMEIRGQMPVTKLGDSTRVYLGAVGNMSITNAQPDEEDIITVYLTWNIDFSDLFATGG